MNNQGNHAKEHESLLPEIMRSRGVTAKQLSEVCGVHFYRIYGLGTGLVAPVSFKGKGQSGGVKPWVQTICNFLGTTPEHVFPRYFCHIPSPDGLTDDQHLDCSFSQFWQTTATKPPQSVLAAKQNRRVLWGAINSLARRERATVVLRYWQGYTLEDVGRVLNVSRERVRQLEAKALTTLKFRLNGAYNGILN